LEHIERGREGFDGSEPRFLLIQAQPWQGVTPTVFRDVAAALSPDHVVVRPDNWFQLLRQANGIPIEPIEAVVDGEYRLLHAESGACVSLLRALTLPDAASEALVQVGPCASDDTERFVVTHTTAGYAKLTPQAEPTWSLSSPDPSAASQAVVARAENATPGGVLGAQEWQPVWESAAGYHVLSRASDQCLAWSGAAPELVEAPCDGSASQRFRFVPADEPVVPETPMPPSLDPTSPPDTPGVLEPEQPAASMDPAASGGGVAAPRSGRTSGCSISDRDVSNDQRPSGAALAFGLSLLGIAFRRRRSR
jgi:hypothetical protein